MLKGRIDANKNFNGHPSITWVEKTKLKFHLILPSSLYQDRINHLKEEILEIVNIIFDLWHFIYLCVKMEDFYK